MIFGIANIYFARGDGKRGCWQQPFYVDCMITSVYEVLLYLRVNY